MEPLLVAAIPLLLLYALFIYPQQKRVKAHSQLVDSLVEGDAVILTAGIHGRIVRLGDDDLSLEVAPGVAVTVARQAVLRRLPEGGGGVGTVVPVEEAETPARPGDTTEEEA